MPRSLQLALLALALAAPAQAQEPVTFGSADDPREHETSAPVAGSFSRVGAYGAPTFLGSDWRLGATVEGEFAAGRVAGRLGGTLHTGQGGVYDPEADEWYDAVRLVQYVRYEPRPGRAVYARLGPVRQMRLGTGLLVDEYRTSTAWDDRTIGVEGAFRAADLAAGAFASDVRPGLAVVGAEAEFRPLGGRTGLQSTRVGVAAVRDIGLADDLTGVEVNARFTALQLFGLEVQPYAAVAHLFEAGTGGGLGADLVAAELAEAAFLRARLGLTWHGARFIPGYVGPFYQVANAEARVVGAEGFFDPARVPGSSVEPLVVGVPLEGAGAGGSIDLELEAVATGSFQLALKLRRHVGGDPFSRFSFRALFHPGRGEGLTAALAFHHTGFVGATAAFGTNDFSALTLDVGYPLSGPLRLELRSRYGYERLREGVGLAPRYLVQRRFEPFVGVRYTF